MRKQLSDIAKRRAEAWQSGTVLALRRGQLATPALWFRHRDTGRRLILVANMHMGEASYWDTLRQRLEELEAAGWSVQCEGYRKAPDAAWATATAAEQQARQVLLTVYEEEPAEVARRLGWVYQRDGLPRADRDRWVNADLTDLEIIRQAGPDGIIAFGERHAAELAKTGRHAAAWQAVLFPRQWRRLARPHARLTRANAQLAPGLHDVLLQQRSRIAAAACDPARDWVVIWGAEHADQIAAALCEAGWQPAGQRRWLVAGRLPSYAQSLAAGWKVSRAVAADGIRAALAERNAQDRAR